MSAYGDWDSLLTEWDDQATDWDAADSPDVFVCQTVSVEPVIRAVVSVADNPAVVSVLAAC